MRQFPSTRHPLTTIAVAGAIVLAACGEQTLVAPQRVVAVNRQSSAFGVESIGDYTWIDANGNGIQDVGEAPLSGVTLNLYAGSTCGGTPLSTFISEAGTGLYIFAGMPPGTYSVAAVTPAGYTPTVVGAGSNPELDSNPSCSTVTIAVEEFNGSLDFGFVASVAPTLGCTPGYWKNHKRWPAPYMQSTQFSAVFADAFHGKTFQQVLSLGGGGLNALGRHTVSALLNAMSIGTPQYGLTSAQVISKFNAAYASGVYEPTKDLFESFSDAYPGIRCPLN